jgi:hypothetical protein
MSGTNGVRAGTGCFAGFGGWAPDTLARFRQTRTHIYYIHGLSLSAAGHDRCRSRARLADFLRIFGRLLPCYQRAFGAGLLKEEDIGFYGLRCTYLLGNKPSSILDILGGHILALVNWTALLSPCRLAFGMVQRCKTCDNVESRCLTVYPALPSGPGLHISN